jgi:hypothetical protein
MSPLTRRTFVASGTAIGLATLGTGLKARSADAPPTGPANGMVSLYLGAQRAMVIVRSGGSSPFPVVFDTGTNGNAVDLNIARRLKLKRVPDHINRVVDGATGTHFDTYEYVMPDLTVGGMAIGDRQIAAYPYDEPDLPGIFGPNLFTGQLVYIDLGSARVRIIDKAGFAVPEYAAIPYIGSPGDGLPAVEIRLPTLPGSTIGGAVMAKLDSGNTDAFHLPPAFIDRVPLKRPAAIVGRATSVSGSRDVMGGQLDGTVRIGPVALIDPDVVFDGQTPNVGLPVVRQLRVLLDPQAEQGWILTPIALPAIRLQDYAGQYGIRRVSLRGDQLVYQRQGGAERALAPLGSDLFDIETPASQIQFERTNGSVSGMALITPDNRIVRFGRDAAA